MLGLGEEETKQKISLSLQYLINFIIIIIYESYHWNFLDNLSKIDLNTVSLSFVEPDYNVNYFRFIHRKCFEIIYVKVNQQSLYIKDQILPN